MARDADTIERDIQQARDALAGALDELGDRVSPQNLQEHGKEIASQTWSDPRVKYAIMAAGGLVALLLLRKLFR